MDKYDSINYYFITNNKLLFFDVFARNNQVVMIIPKYNDYDIRYNNIHIFYNNVKIKNILNYDSNNCGVEKVFIKIYELCKASFSKEIEIKIEYENTIITLNLFHKHIETKFFLSATTLFKDDYKLFTHYYNYYYREGVEFFYMYCNSLLNDDIKKIFEKPNVKLFEWNFDYWNNNTLGEHVAQSGQINHCFYKYGILSSNYMIFNDFDEYMYIGNNITLSTYIKLNQAYDYFMFLNYWSKLLDDKIEENKPNKIVKNKNHECEFYRCKCIAKTNSVDIISIHYPKNTKKKLNYTSKNLSLVHFYSWSNPYRQMNIDNYDIIELVF